VSTEAIRFAPAGAKPTRDSIRRRNAAIVFAGQPSPGASLPLPVSPRAKREKHFEADHFPRCGACGGEVRPGHFVHANDDVGEMHVDCARPYRLTTAADTFVMLGEPMMRIRIREEGSR
jgi:hypothetical protein